MARGKYGWRGKGDPPPHKYPAETIRRLEHRYLMLRVLGYMARGDTIRTLAVEFGMADAEVYYQLMPLRGRR